jgi:hypothetical protein
MVVDVEMKSDWPCCFLATFLRLVRKINQINRRLGDDVIPNPFADQENSCAVAMEFPREETGFEGTWRAHVRPSGVAETEPGGERRDGPQRPARPALESEQLMAMT